MKNLFLLPLLFAGFSGFAQCNLDLSLKSSKTQYLDSTGVVQRTVDENSVIEITKKQVLITPGSGNTMEGAIMSSTCNWATPYKEGNSIIKANFEDESGSTLHATIILEAKDNKATFTVAIAEMPNRKIRVTLDSIQEKK